MKRTAAFLFVVLMLISMPSALAQSYTCEGVFSVTYPNNWIFLDDSDNENNDDEFKSLGILTAPEATGLVVDMTMLFYEDWADFNLFKATEEEAQRYIDIALGDYEDDGMLYRETVYTEKDKIPFAIMVGIDSYGLYVRAETMASGWAILFDLYAYEDDSYSNCRELTLEEYQQFVDIIRSFTPIL